ncbi:hypothetical protein QBZ16_004037 [Prototheca wickerhamii]|uniref:tRNA nucleotidyltransferase/poly(A) polymerase RNA and SrmB- binding domain-containing protein n=1 Tax=Prototheca wickerhamii TaxID=3111 RepID=A0AAD9IGQ3_PROWI|nr:hypothetical protein QBZ16_004037 [Prototheca wickerhamii]
MLRGHYSPPFCSWIAAALQTKVSRERIGSELEGMLTGPRPFHALCLLHRLNLLEPVFGASLDWEAALSTADLAWQGLEEAQLSLDKDAQRDFLAAALLLGLRGEKKAGPKGREEPVSTGILRSSLKWPIKSADRVEALHTWAPRLEELLDWQELGSKDAPKPSPSASEPLPASAVLTMGHALRALRTSWREGFLLAGVLAGGPAGRVAGSLSRLTALAERAGIQDCAEWKPLLDGHRVMSLLGVKGRAVGLAAAAVVDWQLLHPSASAAECERWLLEESDWAQGSGLSGIKRQEPEHDSKA